MPPAGGGCLRAGPCVEMGSASDSEERRLHDGEAAVRGLWQTYAQ